MVGIILIMVGIVFNTFDYFVLTGKTYPDYVKSDELGNVIQQYITQNIFGGELKIDLLPDVLGALFILAGCLYLIKYNKKFIKAFPFLIAAGVLDVVYPLLPFYFNSKELCVNTLFVYLFIYVVQIYGEYIVVYALGDILNALPNQRDIQLMKFGWIASALCRVFIFFLFIVGLMTLVKVYQVVYILSTIFCIDRIRKCMPYLPKKEN